MFQKLMLKDDHRLSPLKGKAPKHRRDSHVPCGSLPCRSSVSRDLEGCYALVRVDDLHGEPISTDANLIHD